MSKKLTIRPFVFVLATGIIFAHEQLCSNKITQQKIVPFDETLIEGPFDFLPHKPVKNVSPVEVDIDPPQKKHRKSKTAKLPAKKITPNIENKTKINIDQPTHVIQKNKGNKRTITVANGVSKKHQKYPYGFLKIKPTEFSISVNGQELSSENPQTIEAQDNKLAVKYYARFSTGTETSKEYIYALSPDTKEVEIDFRWKKEPRVRVSDENATLVQEKVVIEADRTE